MPGGDRTGPEGWGPMTGRGAGFCGGFDVPGFTNWRIGRRFAGRGGGRGWFGMGRGGSWGGGFGRGRRGFFPAGGPEPELSEPMTPREERELLSRQSRALEHQLRNIQARLDALEKDRTEGEE